MRTITASRRYCELQYNRESVAGGISVHGINVRLHVPCGKAPWYILEVVWYAQLASKKYGKRPLRAARRYLVAGAAVEHFLPTIRPDMPRAQVYVDLMAAYMAERLSNRIASRMSVASKWLDSQDARGSGRGYVGDAFPLSDMPEKGANPSEIEYRIAHYAGRKEGYPPEIVEEAMSAMLDSLRASLPRDSGGWYHLFDPVFPIYWADRLVGLIRSGAVSVEDIKPAYWCYLPNKRPDSADVHVIEDGYIPTSGIPFLADVQHLFLLAPARRLMREKGVSVRPDKQFRIVSSFITADKSPIELLGAREDLYGKPKEKLPITGLIRLNDDADLRRVYTLVSQLSSSDIAKRTEAFVLLCAESRYDVPCSIRLLLDPKGGCKNFPSTTCAQVSFVWLEYNNSRNLQSTSYTRKGASPAHSVLLDHRDVLGTWRYAFTCFYAGGEDGDPPEACAEVIRTFIRLLTKRAEKVDEKRKAGTWSWSRHIRSGYLVTLPEGEPPRVLVRKNVAAELAEELLQAGVLNRDLTIAYKWIDIGPLRDDEGLVKRLLSLKGEMVSVGYPVIAFPWRRDMSTGRAVRTNANYGVIHLSQSEKRVLLADVLLLHSEHNSGFNIITEIRPRKEGKAILSPIEIGVVSGSYDFMSYFPAYQCLMLQRDTKAKMVEELKKVGSMWQYSDTLLLRSLRFSGGSPR